MHFHKADTKSKFNFSLAMQRLEIYIWFTVFLIYGSIEVTILIQDSHIIKRLHESWKFHIYFPCILRWKRTKNGKYLKMTILYRFKRLINDIFSNKVECALNFQKPYNISHGFSCVIISKHVLRLLVILSYSFNRIVAFMA